MEVFGLFGRNEEREDEKGGQRDRWKRMKKSWGDKSGNYFKCSQSSYQIFRGCIKGISGKVIQIKIEVSWSKDEELFRIIIWKQNVFCFFENLL